MSMTADAGRVFRLAALAFFALLPAAGCAGFGEGKLGRFPGEVERITPGMTEDKVYETIGQPSGVIQGRGIDINTSILVYPKGLLHIRRMVVTRVEPGALPTEKHQRSIDRVTDRYLDGDLPISPEDEAWYREDEARRARIEREREEERSKRPPIFRPSVPSR